MSNSNPNSKDIYEKLGKIEGKLIGISEDVVEIKTDVKEHNVKIDCLDKKLGELKIHFQNHLSIHNKSTKFKAWFIGIVITLIIAICTIISLYYKIKYGG